MKELSIEEKARRYDEAIEIAKEINNEQQAQPFNVMTRVFPELAESEDERIRKALIDYHKRGLKDSPWFTQELKHQDILSWLEKQSEQPKKHDVCDNCDQQGSCVSPCPMKLVENQGEQEHVIVIPKFRVGDVIRPKGSTAEYTIESISGECYHGKGWGLHISCDNDYELVKQKPAEWSEEDEGMLLEVKCLVDSLHSDGGNANYNTEELQEMWNWLDTIWQRVKYPQPKQEWSEDDNKTLEDIIVFVSGYADRRVNTEWVSWLKSLRPNHWKPSEEQMKALETTLYSNMSRNDKRYSVLSEFVAELKKLKGGIKI